MIAKYTKAIAAFIGAGLTVAVALNWLPADTNVGEVTATLTAGIAAAVGIGAAVVTAISPKNED